MERPIIEIDESRCDGCGLCVLECAEGALDIVDGKAKLVSESFCDGLGACLHCPQEALTIVTREAEAFDEAAVLAAKPQHLSGHNVAPAAQCLNNNIGKNSVTTGLFGKSALPTWPIQLRLISANAPFMKNASILLAAHCTGFALPNLHEEWMRNRVPVIACPKLEPWQELESHLEGIIREGQIASLDILRMSVPCCGGLERLVEQVMHTLGTTVKTQVHIVPTP